MANIARDLRRAFAAVDAPVYVLGRQRWGWLHYAATVLRWDGQIVATVGDETQDAERRQKVAKVSGVPFLVFHGAGEIVERVKPMVGWS